MYAALDNQKRLLKEAARERRKLRTELACAREKSSEDDENVANLDVAKISLSDVSHELAKAKHELELVKNALIVSVLSSSLI